MTFRLNVTFAIILVFPTLIAAQDLSIPDFMNKIFDAAKKVRSLTYTMKKTERFNGKMIFQITHVKYNAEPLQVYLKQEHPTKGLEVLYPKYATSKKAVINPNKFPWFNITADPDGGIMRDDQHHSIRESGYYYFMDILSFLYKKYNTSALISIGRDSVWNGDSCYTVTFDNRYFTYTIDTIKKDENIIDLARRNHIPEYMILELNKNIDDYNDVNEGQILNIPNDYARGMKLIVKKDSYLPLITEVYDDKGMYEKYEYHNLVVNPELISEEFDLNYDSYGF